MNFFKTSAICSPSGVDLACYTTISKVFRSSEQNFIRQSKRCFVRSAYRIIQQLHFKKKRSFFNKFFQNLFYYKIFINQLLYYKVYKAGKLKKNIQNQKSYFFIIFPFKRITIILLSQFTTNIKKQSVCTSKSGQDQLFDGW